MTRNWTESYLGVYREPEGSVRDSLSDSQRDKHLQEEREQRSEPGARSERGQETCAIPRG